MKIFPVTVSDARGVTLIELLLYVSITAAVLLVTSTLLTIILSAQAHQQVIIEVEEQGRQTLQLVTQLARNATAITNPAVGASGASLTFTVVDAAKSPTILTISGGQLWLQEGVAAAVPLTTSRVVASGVTIRNLSRPGTSGTVRLSFTITAANPSGRGEYTYAKNFVASATIAK